MQSIDVLIAIIGGALACGVAAAVWLRRRRRGSEPAAPGESPFEADPPWHEVLGVTADADRAGIEAAHRATREAHLPERVARLGARARRQAQWRLMRIDRAYAAAMRELGLGLGRDRSD
ncbi:hypothetical protein RDV84_05745 [Lysobacter yananisis]|uniref:J domain-containing protein n=1 Tax=Lysobacter yananisis TaxID=1003114 RepID=A0ABY9PBA1_9GAMM|nr:hypothetical protein [Lysobacter yananisis]WMT04340.1 hypothetical protein RDV84_05745 [Lysobacter yananisis]